MAPIGVDFRATVGVGAGGGGAIGVVAALGVELVVAVAQVSQIGKLIADLTNLGSCPFLKDLEHRTRNIPAPRLHQERHIEDQKNRRRRSKN